VDGAAFENVFVSEVEAVDPDSNFSAFFSASSSISMDIPLAVENPKVVAAAALGTDEGVAFDAVFVSEIEAADPDSNFSAFFSASSSISMDIPLAVENPIDVVAAALDTVDGAAFGVVFVSEVEAVDPDSNFSAFFSASSSISMDIPLAVENPNGAAVAALGTDEGVAFDAVFVSEMEAVDPDSNFSAFFSASSSISMDRPLAVENPIDVVAAALDTVDGAAFENAFVSEVEAVDPDSNFSAFFSASSSISMDIPLAVENPNVAAAAALGTDEDVAFDAVFESEIEAADPDSNFSAFFSASSSISMDRPLAVENPTGAATAALDTVDGAAFEVVFVSETEAADPDSNFSAFFSASSSTSMDRPLAVENPTGAATAAFDTGDDAAGDTAFVPEVEAADPDSNFSALFSASSLISIEVPRAVENCGPSARVDAVV